MFLFLEILDKLNRPAIDFYGCFKNITYLTINIYSTKVYELVTSRYYNFANIERTVFSFFVHMTG